MRFSAHSIDEGKYEAKWWLEDDQGAIFRFELPENTVHAWRLAAKQLNFPENSLPDSVSFSNCEFIYDFNDGDHHEDAVLERVAFCKFLLALERENSFSPKKFQSLEIFQKHTQIANLAHQWPYCFLFLQTSDDKFSAEKERDEGEWGYSLEQAYQSNPSSELIADLVSHYDLLREFVYQACKQKPEQALLIAKNYAVLVKAIIHFLDIIQQDSRAVSTTDSSNVVRRLSRKYSPNLSALLVENEALNLDERQEYLNFILARQMSYDERFALLKNILTDLIEDAQENHDNNDAMQTIASLMSQYYLNRYDLDKAVLIWEQTLKIQQNKKDGILRALFRLYKYPRYFIVLLVVFIAFSFLPGVGPISSLILLVIFFSVLLSGLWIIAARFLKKQGFSYLELFLPRLLGSIVVGLSILALESTVWEITFDMTWGNWALTALAAYLGSLTYLFLDIHKNTRLLSDNSEWQKSSINTMERSVKITFKIFVIGLLEAFGLTTMVSSLIPFNALGETFQSLMRCGRTLMIGPGIIIKVLSNNTLVLQLFGPDGFTLTYFPKLIILWAGLSLLIGAFVQLLWQDRQITAS